MPYAMKPLSCDPAHIKGMSERLIISHYENNYGGAVKRLNVIDEQLAALDYGSAPGFLVNGLKREQLIAMNSMILHELFFDGLGEQGGPAARGAGARFRLVRALALRVRRHGDPIYCADLMQIIAIARSERQFSRITGTPREGSFSDTTLPLSGWRDCSLYGGRTYTCDSEVLGAAEQAEPAVLAVVAEIKSCLGDDWREIGERSASSYVVLHRPRAISITISTDQTDSRQYAVRLTMFLRAGS